MMNSLEQAARLIGHKITAWFLKIGDGYARQYIGSSSASKPQVWEEGAPCVLCVAGTIKLRQEDCYCNPDNAPCRHCEQAWLECDECEVTEDVD